MRWHPGAWGYISHREKAKWAVMMLLLPPAEEQLEASGWFPRRGSRFHTLTKQGVGQC